MLSIIRRISSYNHSSGNNIKYIVMHDTGNYKDTAAGNANYFNGGDRQSSAHYFVDDNSIWQVVEDYNAAWHCGDGHGAYGISNHNSIGIEMCNSGGCISEKTINNTLELVKYLMNKYNVSTDRIVRHYDASRKCCPNNMSMNNWSKWNEFKSRLSGTKYTAPTTTTAGESSAGGSYYNVKEVQNMLIKIGYPVGSCGADGSWGNGTKTAVEAFQKDCNLKVDGWVGNTTYAKIKEEYSKKMGIKKEEKKEEEKKVKTLVTYYYPLDQRAAEYVADKLNCPTLFSKRNFDYSCVETIIAVGGNESNYKECNCKPQKIIAGTNRYDTLKAVLDYIK